MPVIVGATGGGVLLLVVTVLVLIFCALLVRKFHSTTDESKSKLHTNIWLGLHVYTADVELLCNTIHNLICYESTPLHLIPHHCLAE